MHRRSMISASKLATTKIKHRGILAAMFYFNFGKKFWWGFGGALGLTFLSLLGYFFPSVGAIFGWLIVLVVFYLAWKKPAWLVVLFLLELIIGFEGHDFEIKGIAIRSILFIVLLLLATSTTFFTKSSSRLWWSKFKSRLRNRSKDGTGCQSLPNEKKIVSNSIILLIFSVVAICAALIGYFISHNSLAAIRVDLISYSFYLAIIPLGIFWPKLWPKRATIIELLIGALAGVAAITLIIFLIFSWQIFPIHGELYKWWRDVIFGKITDTGTNFFRVTAATHLWFIMAALAAAAAWIKKNISNRVGAGLIIIFASPLLINFSRAYLLGVIVGLIIIFILTRTRRAATIIGVVGIIFVAEFFALNLLVSRGQSLGLELFSARTRALADPASETSTRLRAEILPSVVAAVRAHPIIGSGLGTGITFWSSSAQKNITTHSFDWGYLQTWVQLGIVGVVILIVLLLTLFWRGDVFIKSATGALIITHVFGPTFFHPVGIVILVFLWLWCYRQQYEI